MSEDPAQVISYVRALYDYNPSAPEELGFRKGDIIQIHKLVYKDWFRGSLNGKRGVIPSNYICPVPRVRALFDFTATEPLELNFQRGDLIDVIEDKWEGWWKGILENEVGVFPVNYTEKLDLPSRLTGINGKPYRLKFAPNSIAIYGTECIEQSIPLPAIRESEEPSKNIAFEETQEAASITAPQPPEKVTSPSKHYSESIVAAAALSAKSIPLNPPETPHGYAPFPSEHHSTQLIVRPESTTAPVYQYVSFRPDSTTQATYTQTIFRPDSTTQPVYNTVYRADSTTRAVYSGVYRQDSTTRAAYQSIYRPDSTTNPVLALPTRPDSTMAPFYNYETYANARTPPPPPSPRPLSRVAGTRGQAEFDSEGRLRSWDDIPVPEERLRMPTAENTAKPLPNSERLRMPEPEPSYMDASWIPANRIGPKTFNEMGIKDEDCRTQ